MSITQTELDILEKASELKQEYHKNGLKADWMEIQDNLGEEFIGYNIVCDESFRCKVKAFEKKNGILRSKEEVKTQDIEDKLYELEVKTFNLKKERVKLQDEKNRFNKLVRNVARREVLDELISDEIKALTKIKPIEISTIQSNKVTHRTGVLQLSDWHYSLTAENFLNSYNISIFNDRIKEVIEKTILYSRSNEIEQLYILLQGDFISSGIHNVLRIQNQTDVISQIIETSEIIAQIIATLQKELKIPIKVSYVLDNHSRVSADKKDSIDKENYMRITDWFIKDRLKENSKIEFLESDLGLEMSHFNIYDFNCISVHGHKDKFQTIVQSLTAYTRDVYDYMFTSHLHHMNAEEMNMCLVVSNGSLSGVDDYSGSLRMSSHPMQMFSVFVKDYGLQKMYPIIIK